MDFREGGMVKKGIGARVAENLKGASRNYIQKRINYSLKNSLGAKKEIEKKG